MTCPASYRCLPIQLRSLKADQHYRLFSIHIKGVYSLQNTSFFKDMSSNEKHTVLSDGHDVKSFSLLILKI